MDDILIENVIESINVEQNTVDLMRDIVIICMETVEVAFDGFTGEEKKEFAKDLIYRVLEFLYKGNSINESTYNVINNNLDTMLDVSFNLVAFITKFGTKVNMSKIKKLFDCSCF